MSATAAGEKDTGVLVHVVLFQLKDGLPEDEAQALIDDGYNLLAKVPSVRRLHSGRHCDDSEVVNVKDYDVALFCEFDDPAGLADYLEHPLHQEYLDKHSEHWANVRVVDFTAR